MTLTKNARLLFAFSFVAIFGSFLIESESQAQYFRRPPGQELGRFLGLGYGNGYHCRTPGPHADYYNPYSANNSHLVSSNVSPGRYNLNSGYAIGGMNGSVPHSVYTGTQSNGYSVFEGLPGQTVSPTFEPVTRQKSRFQEDLEERNFEDELDLDGDEEIAEPAQGNDGYGSRLGDEQGSAINREQEEEGSGAFESLRENFENIDAEGASNKGALQPSEEDQAASFFSNFGGN